MELVETNNKLLEFSALVKKLDDGRKTLEEMSAFLNDESLDVETKTFLATKVVGSLPAFEASFVVLGSSLTTILSAQS